MHGINETLTWQKHLHEASFGSALLWAVVMQSLLNASQCRKQ